MIISKASEYQAKYKKSEKGKITQAKYYRSEAKRLADEREYKKSYPKVLARKKVHYAVKVGKLIKSPCIECGELKVHAHHDDYSKPLNVLWLCILHHKERHQIMEMR